MDGFYKGAVEKGSRNGTREQVCAYLESWTGHVEPNAWVVQFQRLSS
jgi:hypothetical protein